VLQTLDSRSQPPVSRDNDEDNDEDPEWESQSESSVTVATSSCPGSPLQSDSDSESGSGSDSESEPAEPQTDRSRRYEARVTFSPRASHRQDSPPDPDMDQVERQQRQREVMMGRVQRAGGAARLLAQATLLGKRRPDSGLEPPADSDSDCAEPEEKRRRTRK
jgi:hypothetical protein